MKKPVVSVIVPVYNVEGYLRRCIESILGQSYEKIQIYLVDDGATDLSGKICDDYEKMDKRITVLHKENGGLSSARNAALDIEDGDYIVFIDSDDYVCKDYIKVLLQAIEETKADISVCDFVKGTDEEYIFPRESNVLHKDVYSSRECLEQWHSSHKKNETVAWGKLYRADLFENIRFPEGKLHEDIYITHCVIEKAEKVCFINNKLYYYFERPGSIIKSVSNNKVINHCDAMNTRLEWFEKKGFDDTSKRLLIKYYGHLIYYYFSVHDKECKKKVLEYLKKIDYYFEKYSDLVWSKMTYKLFMIYMKKRG